MEKKSDKLNSSDEKNTYTNEGILYGVSIGIIVSTIISILTKNYLTICYGVSLGMAIGSTIKKKDKK